MCNYNLQSNYHEKTNSFWLKESIFFFQVAEDDKEDTGPQQVFEESEEEEMEDDEMFFKQSLRKKTYVRVGRRATLECEIQARPNVSVRW